MSAAPTCQPVWLCSDVAAGLVGLSASVNSKLHTDNSWMSAEYWATTEKLEKMQRDIQDINAKSPYEPEGSSMTMSHALVHREILRKQVQTLTAILASATLNSRYSTKDMKRVPALDVQSLREKVNSAKKESQQMDIQIQKRNWVIDVP